MSEEKVHIILLNRNGWRDTIECLESVFRTNHGNCSVVVCDNGSTDDSLHHIMAWAEGGAVLDDNDSEIRRTYCLPPVEKPLSYVSYSREEAEKGGQSSDTQLVLIQTGANLGFAGGNNVGIRYVQARNDYAYVWLLNNDCVVHPDALPRLVQRMKEQPTAGMCGSTVVYYRKPARVQALGGARYLKWWGMGQHIGQGQPVGQHMAPASAEQQMDYVLGASMLVSRPLLEKVGLMNEEYFLYFEEIDWAIRARGQFTLTYAPQSIVYHKEGGSIGTDAEGTNRSLAADYYLFKNRLVVTRKYFPLALPTVYVRLVVAMLTRALQGKWEHARMIGKIILIGK